MKTRTIVSPIGALTLTEEAGQITGLRFGGAPGANDVSPLLDEAEAQLQAYFAGVCTTFDLPLAPKGTPFQRAVWDTLRAIPFGETRTYAQIAAAVGNPKACRAVGMANNRNPIAILIPCHRVIGANGSLTGYAGGLAVKKALLALEGVSLA